MLQADEIGAIVKMERLKNQMTLKDLSDATNLSVGFLSQFERGMSSIAIDSLEKVATALGLSLSSFFLNISSNEKENPVLKSYDMRPNCVNPRIIQYVLSHNVSHYDLFPRIFALMPMNDDETIELYSHNGEEFLYVLEGVVTLCLEEEKHVLYPGDSAQIHSNQPHNWINLTNKVTKILTVNVPNPFHSFTTDEEKNKI